MTNPNGPGGGLEVFETVLYGLLVVGGLWLLWRRPLVVVGLVVGLLVWWEQPADDRPILPWLVAFAWFAWRGFQAVARFLVPGRGAR